MTCFQRKYPIITLLINQRVVANLERKASKLLTPGVSAARSSIMRAVVHFLFTSLASLFVEHPSRGVGVRVSGGRRPEEVQELCDNY